MSLTATDAKIAKEILCCKKTLASLAVNQNFVSNFDGIPPLARPSRIHLFAPKTERLLHRTVGVAEQHRFPGRFVRDRAPRWHDERISRFPLVHLVANAAAALSFDHAIHRSV